MSNVVITYPLMLKRSNGTYYETRHSFYTRSKTDTIRRVRRDPLFNYGTAVSTLVQKRSDDAIFWDDGTSSSLVDHLGTLGYGGMPGIMSRYDMEKIVRNQIRAKFKGQTLDLATQLGEYKEAATLFPGAVRKLIGIIRTLKGQDPKRLRMWLRHPWKTAADGASQAWLWNAYAIQPTAMFVADSVNAIILGSPYSPRPIRARAQHTERYTDFKRNPNGSIVSTVGYLKVLGTAQCEVSFDILNGVFSRTGLTNPLQVAWELTTLSFVIDWFIGIGDWLSGLDNMLSFRSPRIIYSSREMYYRTLAYKNAKGAYELRSLNRSSPETMSVFNELEWGSGLHGRRCASAAALLYQFRNTLLKPLRRVKTLGSSSYTE